MRRLALVALVVGVLVMLAGAVYGMLAVAFADIMVGVAVECVGIAILIPALHAWIEGD